MKISRTQMTTQSRQLPVPESDHQRGAGESLPAADDGFDSSRLRNTLVYGTLGGLTASLPGLGVVSSSASLVANLRSDNDEAALVSGLATFLSIGSLVIPEGDAGLLPYIVPGIIGGMAWAGYGYHKAS